MTVLEAKEAMKNHILVGTSNVQSKGGFCLFLTGYLVKTAKVKDKKEEHFRFRDRWGEIEVTRPASMFIFTH